MNLFGPTSNTLATRQPMQRSRRPTATLMQPKQGVQTSPTVMPPVTSMAPIPNRINPVQGVNPVNNGPMGSPQRIFPTDTNPTLMSGDNPSNVGLPQRINPVQGINTGPTMPPQQMQQPPQQPGQPGQNNLFNINRKPVQRLF